MRCWPSSERTTNPSSRRKRQDSLSLSLVLFPPKPLRWVSAGALLGEVIRLPFCIFGVSVWGWYHYPRRSFHAVETLDARGPRWRICRFYATPEFALCGLNLPSAGTTPPQPRAAHTAAHTPKHGGFSGSMVTMFSVVSSSTPSALFRQIRRSPLLLRKDTVIPFLLRASTLLRIRWEKLLGVSPSVPAGSIFSNSTLAGALISGCRRSSSERRKRIRSLGCSVCSQSSDSSFQT